MCVIWTQIQAWIRTWLQTKITTCKWLPQILSPFFTANKLSLFSRKSSNKLIGNTLREMETLKTTHSDTWLNRVEKIENLFKIPRCLFFNKISGKRIIKILKSQFDVHFLNKINEVKLSNHDLLDHNKLRTYKTFKSSFTREPYLDLVRNRNQRCA